MSKYHLNRTPPQSFGGKRIPHLNNTAMKPYQRRLIQLVAISFMIVTHYLLFIN